MTLREEGDLSSGRQSGSEMGCSWFPCTRVCVCVCVCVHECILWTVSLIVVRWLRARESRAAQSGENGMYVTLGGCVFNGSEKA